MTPALLPVWIHIAPLVFVVADWLLPPFERDDKHEIRNTGRYSLRTPSFYGPRAYTNGGVPSPATRLGGS